MSGFYSHSVDGSSLSLSHVVYCFVDSPPCLFPLLGLANVYKIRFASERVNEILKQSKSRLQMICNVNVV